MAWNGLASRRSELFATYFEAKIMHKAFQGRAEPYGIEGNIPHFVH